jgi:hypothetical protein
MIMNSVTVDCGNGWKVRVSMCNGSPFITAEYEENDWSYANSVVVTKQADGVNFDLWHKEKHSDDDAVAEWTLDIFP